MPQVGLPCGRRNRLKHKLPFKSGTQSIGDMAKRKEQPHYAEQCFGQAEATPEPKSAEAQAARVAPPNRKLQTYFGPVSSSKKHAEQGHHSKATGRSEATGSRPHHHCTLTKRQVKGNQKRRQSNLPNAVGLAPAQGLQPTVSDWILLTAQTLGSSVGHAIQVDSSEFADTANAAVKPRSPTQLKPKQKQQKTMHAITTTHQPDRPMVPTFPIIPRPSPDHPPTILRPSHHPYCS